MELGQAVVAILQQHGVEVVFEGKNVARGNANIRCPFCPDDPSHHLGIHLRTGAWGCWRSAAHRGRRPEPLLARALGWTVEQARAALQQQGAYRATPAPQNLVEAVRARLARTDPDEPPPHEPGALSVRRAYPYHQCSARVLSRVEGVFYATASAKLPSACRPHIKYLRERGILQGARNARYQLCLALTGEFAARILFPVRAADGTWLSFTARAISPSTELRYKTLDNRRALAPGRELVWNLDAVERHGARVLVVTEGPVDALQVDQHAEDDPRAVRAVALLSVASARERLDRIRAVVRERRVPRVLVVLDKGFELQAVQMASALGGVAQPVPYGAKDLGELSARQIQGWVQTLLTNERS